MNKTDLLEKVKSLDGLTQDERAYLMNLVNTKKKYGLVWEDKPEEVEEQLRENLPVLKEVKEKAIINGEEHPNHILIEGDNLHALTALTFTHEGKIDVIYIDPPYNTGNKDFKYNDTFVDKEDSYRHSKWLSFMDKRLRIAKRLLSDKGVIFISIDDNEAFQLKLLLDEIYGNENFICDFIRKCKAGGGHDSKEISIEYDHMLFYSKNRNNVEVAQEIVDTESEKKYKLVDNFVERRGRYYLRDLDYKGSYSESSDYPIVLSNGKELFAGGKFGKPNTWRWGKEKFEWGIKNDFIVIDDVKEKVYIKQYQFVDNEDKLRERMLPYRALINFLNSDGSQEIRCVVEQNIFTYPKPTSLIKFCLNLRKDNEITILDFFAGSGTTLHATMALNAEDGGNRQCILVTNNENNICEEVTYERNKRVIQGYTNAKGVAVEGLKNNNLRYYKSAFVSREPSLKNKRELTQLATELLCIKEDCYSEQKIHIKQARLFANNKATLLILFDDYIIPQAVDFIKGLEATEIKVYVFSMGSDPYTEDFADVLDKVTLCPIPDSIYNAYRNVLPKKNRVVPVLEEEYDYLTNENGE
jgi:adenine-specific DNA-methyltransferase